MKGNYSEGFGLEKPTAKWQQSTNSQSDGSDSDKKDESPVNRKEVSKSPLRIGSTIGTNNEEESSLGIILIPHIHLSISTYSYFFSSRRDKQSTIWKATE